MTLKWKKRENIKLTD